MSSFREVRSTYTHQVDFGLKSTSSNSKLLTLIYDQNHVM
jgi:hypothetical protein